MQQAREHFSKSAAEASVYPSYSLQVEDCSKISPLKEHVAQGLWYLSFREVIVAIYSSLRVLTKYLYQESFMPDSD